MGGAGTVAYAKINPDFRHTVEDLVPGSQSALNILLGPSRSGLLALLLLLLICGPCCKTHLHNFG